MIISHCKEASTTRDKFWRTPMHICAANGSIHCAEILVVPAAETVRNLDRFSATPLHYASAFGHEEMVNFLLDNNVDPNAQDKKERRPLHYAAYGGHFEIVQILTRNGADASLADVQV